MRDSLSATSYKNIDFCIDTNSELTVMILGLEEILDKCFNGQYLPHILKLVDDYAFDALAPQVVTVVNGVKHINGRPYDEYLRLTQAVTAIHKRFVWRHTYTGLHRVTITEYRVRGKLHRLDGPAFIDGDWMVYYYINDKLHRDDGPAKIDSLGNSTYYRHGQRHRIGGPAVTFASGTVEYWEDDEIHRLDGPAHIGASGELKYWQRGKLHRIGGPAQINYDGTMMEYLQDNKLHREDGPAVVWKKKENCAWSSDHAEYWVNGNRMYEWQFKLWRLWKRC